MSKKYNTAKVEFKNAIETNKKDIDAHLKYAQDLIDLKKNEESIKVCSDALKIEERATIYFLRGKAYRELYDELYDENANTYDNHREDYVENGSYQAYLGAERSFKKAVELDPQNALYNYSIGQWQLEVGDQRQNWKTFEYLENSVKLDPNLFEAQICLGNYYFETRQYKKAIACFKQAAKAAPNDENALVRSAIMLGAFGETEEAINNLVKANEIVKDDIVFTYLLGTQYQANGEYDKAIECYQKPQSIEPTQANSQLEEMLAVLEQEGITPDQISSDLGQAITSTIGAPGRFTEWLMDMVRWSDKTWDCYSMISEKLYLERAQHNIGSCYFDQGEYEKALVIFNEMLVNTKQPYLLHNHIGLALIELGKEEEAISHWETAKKMAKHIFIAYANHAKLFLKKGDLENAQKQFELGLENLINIEDEHHQEMADLYLQFGFKEEALKINGSLHLKEARKKMSDKQFEEAKELYKQARKEINDEKDFQAQMQTQLKKFPVWLKKEEAFKAIMKEVMGKVT